MAKIPTLAITSDRNKFQIAGKIKGGRKNDFIPGATFHGPQQGPGSSFGPSFGPLGPANAPSFRPYFNSPGPYFPTPGPFRGPPTPHNVMPPYVGPRGPPPGPPVPFYGPANFSQPPPHIGPPSSYGHRAGPQFIPPGPNQPFCGTLGPPQGLPQVPISSPVINTGQLPGTPAPYLSYPPPLCVPPPPGCTVEASFPPTKTENGKEPVPSSGSAKEQEKNLKKPPICGRFTREIKAFLHNVASIRNNWEDWRSHDKQCKKLSEMAKSGTLFDKWNDQDIEDFKDLYFICNKIFKKWLNHEYDNKQEEKPTVLTIPQTDLERVERMKKTLRPPIKGSKRGAWDEYDKITKQIDVLHRIAIHPDDWKNKGEEPILGRLLIDNNLVDLIKTKLRQLPNKTKQKCDWDEYSKQCMALSAWVKKASEAPEWKDQVIIEESTAESVKQVSKKEEKLEHKVQDSSSSPGVSSKRSATKRKHVTRTKSPEKCNGEAQPQKMAKLDLNAASEAGPSDQNKKRRAKIQDPAVQRRVESVVHAAQCQDTACSVPSCLKIRKLTKHYEACKKKIEGGCAACKALVKLRIYHSKFCQDGSCPLSFCQKLKNKLGTKPPQPTVTIKPKTQDPPPVAVKQESSVHKSTVKRSTRQDRPRSEETKSPSRLMLREIKKKLLKARGKMYTTSEWKEYDKLCDMLDTLYKKASDCRKYKEKGIKERKPSRYSYEDKRLMADVKAYLFSLAITTKTRADWEEYETQNKMLNDWLKLVMSSQEWKSTEIEEIKLSLWSVEKETVCKIKAKLQQVAKKTNRKADLEEYEKQSKQLDCWLWRATLPQVQREQKIEGNKNFYNVCAKVLRERLDSLYDMPKRERISEFVKRILKLRRLKKWMEEKYKTYTPPTSSSKQHAGETKKKTAEGAKASKDKSSGKAKPSEGDANDQAKKNYRKELEDISEESLPASERSTMEQVAETESILEATALEDISDENFVPSEGDASEHAKMEDHAAELEDVSEEGSPEREQAEKDGEKDLLDEVSAEGSPQREQAEKDGEEDLLDEVSAEGSPQREQAEKDGEEDLLDEVSAEGSPQREQAEKDGEEDLLDEVSAESSPEHEQAEKDGDEELLEEVSADGSPSPAVDSIELAEDDERGVNGETLEERPERGSPEHEQAEKDGEENLLEELPAEGSPEHEQAEKDGDEEVLEEVSADGSPSPAADSIELAEDDERSVNGETSEERPERDTPSPATDAEQIGEEGEHILEEELSPNIPVGNSLSPVSVDSAEEEDETHEGEVSEEKPAGNSPTPASVESAGDDGEAVDESEVSEEQPAGRDSPPASVESTEEDGEAIGEGEVSEETPAGDSPPPTVETKQPTDESERFVEMESSEEKPVSATTNPVVTGDDEGPPTKIIRIEKEEDNNSSSTDDQKQLRTDKTLEPTVQQRVHAVVHATFCKAASCDVPNCLKIKQLIKHAKTCKRKANTGCIGCKSLAKFRIYHSKYCEADSCPLPFCCTLKIKLGIQLGAKVEPADQSSPDGVDSTSNHRAEQSSA